MRASSLPAGTDVGAVEQPSQGQIAVAEVPGCDFGERVIASTHDDAGALAIQVGRAGEETINAVTVSVSPIRNVTAGWLEVDRGLYRPGLAVEHRQKLRTAEDTTGGGAEIRVRISDHLPRATACAVGGLADDFGFAVSIEVIHLKL